MLDRWFRTRPTVLQVADARAYLERRAIDPERIARADVARVMTTARDAPERLQGFKGAVGLPCIVVALLDLDGTAVGMIGRSIRPDPPRTKSVSARGPRAGLPMLSPMAELAITGAPLADLGIRSFRDLTLIVSEGEVDFMTWVAREPDACGTIGIVSGSWTEDLAGCIPSTCTVVVRTDPDPAGDRLAAAVHASLFDRCTVLRPVRGAA